MVLSEWTTSENKKFEQALAFLPRGSLNRWERIADYLQKSVGDVVEHYDALVHDIIEIDSGRVDVPHYMDDSAGQTSKHVQTAVAAGWESAGQTSKHVQTAVAAGWESAGQTSKHGKGKQKRGNPWSDDEHKNFLRGVEKYGNGDWKNISRNVVRTRTPSQVASHAQKYFLRQNSVKERKRSSIHDITTVDTNLPMPGSNIGQQENPCSSSEATEDFGFQM